MADFSVTLPSNVERSIDPDNRPSKYITRLSRPIELTGEWEVAATRLQFEHNWRTELPGQWLGVYVRDLSTIDDRDHATQSLLPGAANTTDTRELAWRRQAWLQESWATPFLKKMNMWVVKIPTGKYASADELGRALCIAINEAYHQLFPLFRLRYEYQSSRNRVQLTPVIRGIQEAYVVRIATVRLPGDPDVELMEQLGFSADESGDLADASGQVIGTYRYYGASTKLSTVAEQKDKATISLQDECALTEAAIRRPRLPENRQLFLYSDVGCYRHVGDTVAQLLDTVVVTVPHGDTENALRGTKANYVTVYRKNISSIEIRLTDHTGVAIEFTNPFSPVIVTLHFRQVRHA